MGDNWFKKKEQKKQEDNKNPVEKDKEDYEGSDLFFLGTLGTCIVAYVIIFLGALDSKFALVSSKSTIIFQLNRMIEIVVNRLYDLGYNNPQLHLFVFYTMITLFAVYGLKEIYYNPIAGLIKVFRKKEKSK